MSTAGLLLTLHLLLALTSAGHALLSKRDPRSALGWIVVCLTYPFIGTILYCILGVNRIKTKAHLIKGEPLKPIKIDYERPEGINFNQKQPLPKQIAESELLHALARSSEAVTHRPLVEGNCLVSFYTGDSAYNAMIESINNAQLSVCMTSYIFDTNHTGHRFINALTEANTRGVSVRVLIDGIGELYGFPFAGSLLKKKGIAVARFLPPKLWPPSIHINLRNHRKILVVDEKEAFTGGMNISDRHLLKLPDGSTGISDIHFKLTGDITYQLQQAFNEDWQFVNGGEIPDLHYAPNSKRGNAVCRVITDGPNEDLDKLTLIMTNAVSLARKSVSIMSPYFIPPITLVSALQGAALRGVAVTIILPEKSNQPLADWATKNMLWELLQYGVKIYYQPAPFAHSKLFLIDDDYAHIGSANLDPRSLRLNFELVVEIFDSRFIFEMTNHFEQVRTNSIKESLINIDSRSLIVKIKHALAWLFSAYL